MPAKRKTNIITLLILAAIGLGAIILVARFMGLTERPAAATPRLETQTQARSFAVVAINKDSYKVRDLDTNAETTLFVPAGPEIIVGNILAVKKYVMATNGLVASELSVLPPVPTKQPPKNLSKNPENK